VEALDTVDEAELASDARSRLVLLRQHLESLHSVRPWTHHH
jgi:hypothetical protein